MKGIPIQVFELTEGFVVSIRYQNKKKDHVTISHFCEDTDQLGARTAELINKYNTERINA